MRSSTSSPSRLLIACLCAEWCSTCRDYRTVFRQALAGFDPSTLSCVWVDIEDHEKIVGSIDVQNFPTLLVARDDQVSFFGAVVPHAQTLTRMVQGALDASFDGLSQDAEVHALAARVRAFQAAGSNTA